ncbi:MAG: DEAD/DEAH box helicase [Deinococcales bacterium]
MTDLELKNALKRTWSVFFASHGNFTEVQVQAMPLILAGKDVLIASATASGKTEAALVPLLERHLLPSNPTKEQDKGLKLLYLCPTRALGRDLLRRLKLPLEALKLSMALKTGDTASPQLERPPTLLISTPESIDALLTRIPKLFSQLKALIIDEIHLFDDSPRGDQVRALIERLESIRRYGQPQLKPMQRVLLSATIAEPKALAARYLLPNFHSVIIPQQRELDAELHVLSSLDDLAAALAARGQPKSLIFCNTRHEVEGTANYLRQQLSFEADILVHYANIEAKERFETERRFAESRVAVCVASSTLELGIDIGDIDQVVLIGPPANLEAFLQRLGRAGRRRQQLKLLAFARSVLEWRHFEALLRLALEPHPFQSLALPPKSYHYRLSIIIQQIFSRLKQSPNGAIRLVDIRRIIPPEVPDKQLEVIVHHLSKTDYLTEGRMMELKAGPRLLELIDEHEIYSNIGDEPLLYTIIDAYSNRYLAQVEQSYEVGTILLLAGRSMKVLWSRGYVMAVTPVAQRAERILRLQSKSIAVALSLSRAVAWCLELSPQEIIYLPRGQGGYLFHFWGDVYGEWLAAYLRLAFNQAQTGATIFKLSNPQSDDPEDETGQRGLINLEAEVIVVQAVNDLYLYLSPALSTLPPWHEGMALEAFERVRRRLLPWLELGRFYTLLPSKLVLQSGLEQADLKRFAQLYQYAKLNPASETLEEKLLDLL